MQELVTPPTGVERNVNRPLLGVTRRTAIYSLAVCVGYYAAAKIGFALTFPNYAVSALWPTNAFLLAVLLLAPRRTWWTLLLAALVAHLAAELGSGVPILMVLCWFVSNCAEALIGAVLIRRNIDGVLRFDRSRHVAVFIASATVAIVLTSFLDAGFVVLNGWGTRTYWEVLRMRSFSNAVAALTIVPVMMATVAAGIAPLRRKSLPQIAELCAFGIGLIAVDLMLFESSIHQQALVPAMVYAPLILLVWASLRLGPSIVSGSLLATALLAIKGTMHGHGPFTTMSPPDNVLSMQAFLITMTVPLLFLAAFVRENSDTHQALGESQERLARTEAFSIVMVTHVGLDGRWLRVPPTLCERLGYTEDQLLARKLDDVTHPDDYEQCWSLHQSLLSGRLKSFDRETRYVHKNGSILWIDVNSSLVTDARGKPLYFLTYVKDITERKRSEAALQSSEERIRDLATRLLTAQEQERKRIARDLHDDLIQRVAAVAIGLSALKRRIRPSPDPVQDHVLALQNGVSEIADRVRALSHELHSSALEHAGLSAALTSLCEEFRDQRGIEIDLDTRGNLVDVPEDVGLCLYRLVQESLRNVAKHSGATHAEVVVVGDGESVRLTVRDDGTGFDYAAARKSGGLGLVSMEERVRGLSGSFLVNVSPGHGTVVLAEIPIGEVSHVESTGSAGGRPHDRG